MLVVEGLVITGSPLPTAVPSEARFPVEGNLSRLGRLVPSDLGCED